MDNSEDEITTSKRYNQLVSLKAALGIDKDKETSSIGMLEISKEHNKEEVFLLDYIITKLKELPVEIKSQFDNLITAEKNGNFLTEYKKTEKMFNSNPVFKSYWLNIYKELELYIDDNIYFFNLIIYEIAYNDIGPDTLISAGNPVINLYLLQKWLKKYDIIPIRKLSAREKFIIKALLDGCNEEEILTLYIVTYYSDIDIDNMLENELPLKFNVTTILQVLTLYLYKYV